MAKLNLKRKDEDDLEELFRIGVDLIDENRRQPLLMVKVSRIYKEKYLEYKRKTIQLDILKDELAETMRSDPKKWNLKPLDRLTDALVNRIVVRDISYQLLYDKWAIAKAEAKAWEGIVEACKQRSHTLARLTKLNNDDDQ